VRSLVAAWRLSLARTRADWPIVAAGWLITLLATVLFAAGPIYSSAAAVAGLRRTLADGAVTDTSVQASVYGTPAYVTSIDHEVQSDLQAAVSPLAADIVRDGRAGATLQLPARPDRPTRDRAVLGFLDGLPDHAHLTQGGWPAATNATEPLQVVLLDVVANDMGLALNDEVTLVAPNIHEPVAVPVRLVGTFTVDDAADAYWDGDEQLTTGIIQSGRDRTLGPFLTAPESILSNAALSSVHMRWRAIPDFNGLTVDNVAGVHDRVQALPARLPKTATGKLTVETGLPDILGAAQRSLLVSRTQLLLLMAQLAIIAAYAILLTASLLVDHRRVTTALLRSRGAGSGHIAWLAFLEALLLVVPAVLVAPWLALAEAKLLGVVGPLADIGLVIEPSITSDSYLLAGLAGLLCLVVLVLPAFLAARSFTSEERDLSRQETRTLGQRLGLDGVLLAVSVIALWQLSLYGAPLTKTVQGTLGFDPLLVAAPALGLLAGGILALRVLPLLAAAMESWISRGRDAVASLGSRQLARRPLRYTRTALLLMLALSLGVFGLSFASTWSSSQEDQAAYQAGADVRVILPSGTATAPKVAAAYAGIPSVLAAMPVERVAGGVSAAKGSGSVDLLALDAETAGSIVRFRGDESTHPLGDLMRSLREGRPAPDLLALSQDAAYLQVVPVLEVVSAAEEPSPGPDGEPVEPTPDPDVLDGVGLTAVAIVFDSHGHLYRLSSGEVTINGALAPILLPLQVAGPLSLAALEIDVLHLPQESLTTRVGVTAVSAGATADGPWTAVPADNWAIRMAEGTDALEPAPTSLVDGMVVAADGERKSFLWAFATGGRVLFTSKSVDALDTETPVIANAAFVAANGVSDGGTIEVTIDGARRTLSVAGVVKSFATTDPKKPLLLFDEPTLDLYRLQAASTTRNVDEWWMAAEPASSEQVAAALRAEPFNSKNVVTAADRTRALTTDPVALGIIGALLLGFVATAIFALVALVVSAAVSARQRRTEFALLRALGLSAGQLSRWLWLENGSLVVASLVAGTVVGVVISAIALPFITVTQEATTPVPDVVVHLPWDRILALDLIVVVALGLAVAILGTVLRRIGVGTILRLGED
jgi:ABC-type lipoprotein release transport system permease subunit